MMPLNDAGHSDSGQSQSQLQQQSRRGHCKPRLNFSIDSLVGVGKKKDNKISSTNNNHNVNDKRSDDSNEEDLNVEDNTSSASSTSSLIDNHNSPNSFHPNQINDLSSTSNHHHFTSPSHQSVFPSSSSASSIWSRTSPFGPSPQHHPGQAQPQHPASHQHPLSSEMPMSMYPWFMAQRHRFIPTHHQRFGKSIY